jgi:hypothetical protein
MITAGVWLLAFGLLIACERDRDSSTSGSGALMTIVACVLLTIGINR